jgi:hypothetical protein
MHCAVYYTDYTYPPDFSASRFSRNFSDLETPIYRAPLYYIKLNKEASPVSCIIYYINIINVLWFLKLEIEIESI